MITVEEAKSLVLKHAIELQEEEIEVTSALGFYLSENLVSSVDMPPFDQSAMDGYVINFLGNCKEKTLRIRGEIKAGDTHQTTISDGEAIRIFTGAPVPNESTAVVMQEKVTVDGEYVSIDGDVVQGSNIRYQGEQIKKGELALEKGTLLTPAAIGFISMLGINKVKVTRKPKISVLVTGSELAKPGTKLKFGQVYECNSDSLTAAIQQTGFTVNEISSIPDDYELTKQTLDDAITTNEVLVISGGISVGDYDFVGKALKELEVEQVYYKIKQKPGKPMFFGKKGNTLIFALPGNPSAAILCYYQYVLMALKKRSGAINNYGIREIKLSLMNDFVKKGDRAQFLKAKITEEGVDALGSQSSAMLNTFAVSDGLIYVPHDVNEIKAGSYVSVHLLPK